MVASIAAGVFFSRIGQVFGRLKREEATQTDGDVEAPRDVQQPPMVVGSDAAVIPSIQIGSASDNERSRI
ncbi:ubiquitin-conjugating enzyme h [Apiospora arundinis]